MDFPHQSLIIAHSYELVKLYRCPSVDVVQVVADFRVNVAINGIIVRIGFWIHRQKYLVEAITASTGVYET